MWPVSSKCYCLATRLSACFHAPSRKRKHAWQQSASRKIHYHVIALDDILPNLASNRCPFSIPTKVLGRMRPTQIRREFDGTAFWHRIKTLRAGPKIRLSSRSKLIDRCAQAKRWLPMSRTARLGGSRKMAARMDMMLHDRLAGKLEDEQTYRVSIF